MKKTEQKALLHEVHLVLGMVLVMIAIGVMVFFYKEPENREISSNIWNAEDSSTARVVPFKSLASGLQSKVAMRVNYFITSAAELEELWKIVDVADSPPKINFDKEAVIAVFAGQQPTAGYSVQVSKIVDSGARLVSITLTAPAANCLVGQALTAPYEVITVPATSLPLVHEDVQTTVGCTD